MTNGLEEEGVVAEAVDVVGVGGDDPFVHLLCTVVVVTHGLEEEGVPAEGVGVVRVGGDGPLVHLLRTIVITTHIFEEAGVVAEADGVTGKVILGVSWVISGRRYYDGPPPWGIMGVKETSP